MHFHYGTSCALSSIAVRSTVGPAPSCAPDNNSSSGHRMTTHARRRCWHPDAVQYGEVEDGGDSNKAFGVEEGVAREGRANGNSPLGDSTAAHEASFSWMPIVAISLTLVMLSTTLSSLYTYVGVYVQHVMDLDSRNSAGYYAGWLASAFTIGRLTTGYAWGIFADRYGRKPVLVIGMISVAVCSIGFGLSTSFAAALLWRFFFGMTISVWSVSRIIIPEILGPDRVVLGMACMPASSAIGIVLGPAFGGLLAQPAENYPDIFSESGLFGRHPFLLPNLALALLALVLLPAVLIYLPETFHMVDKRRACAVARSDSLQHVGSGSINGGTSAVFHGRGGEYDDHDDAAEVEDEESRANGLASCGGHGLDVLRNNRVDGLKSHELRQSTRTMTIGNNSVSSTASFMNGDDLMYGSDQKGSREYGDAGSRYPRVRSMLASLRCDCRGSYCARSPFCDSFSCCSSSTRVWSIVPSSPPCSGGREGGGRGVGDGGTIKLGGSVNWCGPGGLLTPWSVRMILVLELLLAVTKIGFDESFPLWAIITRDDGGLEWAITKIGKVLTWTGVGMMFYQFIGYPFLCRTVGIVRMLHVMGVMASVALGVMPDILRRDWSNGGSYFVSIAIFVVIDAGTSVWNIGAALAAVNAVPVHRRGQFMGLFTVAETFGRAVSPAGVGSLLAWSVQYSVDHNSNGNVTSTLGSLVDYHLTFVILALTFSAAVAIGSGIVTLERLTIPFDERRAVDGVDGGCGVVGSTGDRRLAPSSRPYAPVVLAPLQEGFDPAIG